MIHLPEMRSCDPIDHWCQDHSIPSPALQQEVALAMPGCTLRLRTNHAGLESYVRDRCHYLLHPDAASPDVVAEVLCFPGTTWPPVGPRNRTEELTTASVNAFHSVMQDGILCTWKPPTLMGSLREGGVPQIRVLATEPNPRLLPPVLDGQRLRLNGAGLKYPSVLDLVFCLLGRLQGFTVLHGAMIEKAGLGVLLLGESGCGKTTAALTLVRGGFRITTDEYAVLWNRGHRQGCFAGILVPPMMVGEPLGGREQLEETLGLPREFGKNPFPLRKDQTRLEPVNVAAVLALERPERRQAAHQATPLTPEETFAAMMHQLRDPIRNDRSDAFEAMLHVSATVPGHRVAVGLDLKSFPQFVENLMAGKGARP